MVEFQNFTRLALTLAVLGGGWAAFAQVQTKPKSNPAVKKTEPSATNPAAKPNKDEPTSDVSATRKPEKEVTAEKTAVQEEKDADAEAIRAGAAKFVEAYNSHDSKALAALFAEKAEFLDEDGNLIKGREAIEADFARMFEDFPDCKLEIEVESIRVLTPHIAVEEGLVRGQPVPDETGTASSYIAIHVKVDDQWLVGSVSDTANAPEEMTPHDHLQELAWMEGSWVDENHDSMIRSTCRWDDSGNYLLHDFEVQIAGAVSATGSMRIGWDPLTKQLKSWTFDIDGGYSEGLWTRIEDEWVVKAHGVNAHGEATSAVSVFRYIDEDTLSWHSYDRTVGGQPAESVSESVIKRQPPAPGT